jgi:hypothetical protein
MNNEGWMQTQPNEDSQTTTPTDGPHNSRQDTNCSQFEQIKTTETLL